MRIVVTSRKGGKTATLVDHMVHNPNAIAVVATLEERRYLLIRLKNVQPNTDWEKRVLYLDSVLDSHMLGPHGHDLCIDNLDMILGRLFPRARSFFATATGYSVEPLETSISSWSPTAEQDHLPEEG